jgi:hypothetical protein
MNKPERFKYRAFKRDTQFHIAPREGVSYYLGGAVGDSLDELLHTATVDIVDDDGITIETLDYDEMSEVLQDQLEEYLSEFVKAEDEENGANYV